VHVKVRDPGATFLESGIGAYGVGQFRKHTVVPLLIVENQADEVAHRIRGCLLGEDLVGRYDFFLVPLVGHKDVEEFLWPDGSTDEVVIRHSVHDESPFAPTERLTAYFVGTPSALHRGEGPIATEAAA
jgi:hypothetical protein